MTSHRIVALATAGSIAAALFTLAGCDAGKVVNDSQSFAFPGSSLTIDSREATLVLANGTPGRIGVDRSLKGNATDAGAATLTLEGNTLKLWVTCSGFNVGCSGSHTVHVPPGIAIHVTASGSAVSGDGLTGAISTTLTRDATLKLTNPSGDLTLNTAGGGVNVEAARSPHVVATATNDGTIAIGFAAPPASVRAIASDGYAKVSLPAGPETYRLVAPVDGGLPSDPASGRTILVQARGNSSVVKAG